MNKGSILMYKSIDGDTQIKVVADAQENTVWLNAEQIANLY